MPIDLQQRLAAMLAPMTPDTFAEKHFGRKPVHLKGTPERARDVMNWSTLCDLLNMASLWTPDRVVLYLDQQRVPTGQYCTVLDEGGRAVQRPSAKLVQAWVERGASVIVNDVGPLTPGLREWVALLTAATAGNVQVNLYASRAEHQAFPPHFDTHEVFALHCEGEKTWRIYDLRAEHPINHPAFPKTKLPPDMAKYLESEIVVHPGDVVYVPRGTYHEALAGSYGTLHVTFGVTRPIGLDLLSSLWQRLVGDASFRAPLPLSSGLQPRDDAALAAHMADLMRRLSDMATEPQTLQFLQGMVSRFTTQSTTIGRDAFTGKD